MSIGFSVSGKLRKKENLIETAKTGVEQEVSAPYFVISGSSHLFLNDSLFKILYDNTTTNR